MRPGPRPPLLLLRNQPVSTQPTNNCANTLRENSTLEIPSPLLKARRSFSTEYDVYETHVGPTSSARDQFPVVSLSLRRLW